MAPNAPKTPNTTMRIPLDLKEQVVAKAAGEGRTLTDVVLDKLREYIDQGDQK